MVLIFKNLFFVLNIINIITGLLSIFTHQQKEVCRTVLHESRKVRQNGLQRNRGSEEGQLYFGGRRH